MARVESALRRLDGVEAVEMDCLRSRVVLTPQARRLLDLSRLPTTIARSSDQGMRYRAARCTVLAAGTVERSGRERLFRITGWPLTYPLEQDAPVLEGACRVEAEVTSLGEAPRLRVLRVLPSPPCGM